MTKKFVGHTNRSSRSNIAERIAFDPFLSQESLINEMIRNMINPDSDSNQAYYTGQVVNIIKVDNQELDIRDVFYSISDNYERATKSVPDKKYDLKRVILLIHIPSFITNNRQAVSNLNYDNFNKLRVEYGGDKPVNIGDLVKIQFRDKNGFYDPYIIGIENVKAESITYQNKIAKASFDNYLNCKVNSLNFSTDINAVDFKQITIPAGGYIQALKAIDDIFSNSYIESFKKTLTKDFGEISKIFISVQNVKVYSDVYNEFKGNYEYKYRLDSFIEQDKSYLIKVSDLIISSKNDPGILRGKFIDYIKQDISSKYNFTISVGEGNVYGNGFYLDINSNLIINKTTTQKNVNDYIEVSKKILESQTYYSSIPASGSSPAIIQKSNAPDKCDSELGQNNSTYKLVYYEDKSNKLIYSGFRTQDSNVVSKFYSGSINTKSFLTEDYLYQIANISSPSDLLGTSKFYVSSGPTDQVYGSKNNRLNVEQLPNFLKETLNFLIKMKTYIEKMEGLSSDQVLLLPIQVIKNKKTLLGKQDPNSRHFYGKAADIVIYLKLVKSDGTIDIVQIPPEVVSLYAQKISEFLNINIGQGIFLNSNKFYNHIELLNDSGLSKEEISKRVYTANENEIENKIEKVSAPSRINYIKQIIKEGNNYKVLGQLPQKFIGLTE